MSPEEYMSLRRLCYISLLSITFRPDVESSPEYDEIVIARCLAISDRAAHAFRSYFTLDDVPF